MFLAMSGRPGGFVMQNNHSQLTLLQAVALAGGTLSSAVPSHARLIRRSDSGYKETQINFSAIQKGKAPDLQLNPDDVIYIPYSYLRNIAEHLIGNRCLYRRCCCLLHSVNPN